MVIGSADEDRASGRADQLNVPAEPELAVVYLREWLGDHPFDAAAYRALAKALKERKSAADTGLIRSSVGAPVNRMAQAAAALESDDLETAEIILRSRLLNEPQDPGALHMLAHLGSRLGFTREAEQLFRQVIELVPQFSGARYDLAKLLQRETRNEEALQVISEVVDADPTDVTSLYLQAVILGHMSRFEEAVAIYRKLVEMMPREARLWASYGRSLKTVGRSEEGIEKLRHATQVDPGLGEAWWSLSDFKTVRLDERDIDTMQSSLVRAGISDKDRYYLHFALGKAHEDKADHEASFRHYAAGNAIRRDEVDHDPDVYSTFVQRSIEAFTPAFFNERQGAGCDAPDPIFVLGMPRAGSTLIEQILASHPQIEGTAELPQVLATARGLAELVEDRVGAIASLPTEQFAELGRRYLEDTRINRKTNRPFFVDKMPNNWLYVPLIHLMLPNARIIDARRHPLACCFSNFKQNFAQGQSFSYDLEHLGRFYTNYVRLMAHVDAILPGKVHRVFHEDVVDDLEREVRRLLAFLDLPFDAACLQFHKNDRAVRTASAEQVRQPINRKGVDQWRPYEPWLEPLKRALGPVLDLYPQVPDFET